MPPSDDELSQADLLERRVQKVLDIPLHRFLGLRLADPARPAQGIVLEVGDTAMNNAEVMHGGILSGLLDVACYLSVLPSLGPGENAVTHDVSLSILRSVRKGSRLHLRGQVVRLGRTTVFTRAEATVEDQVVAFGHVTKSRVATST